VKQRFSIFFLAILALVVFTSLTVVHAADSDTLTILRSIEGKWNSEILGMDGKKYIRPWVFQIKNNFFTATIKRPGMQPEECKVPLEEISNEGGKLTLNIDFPPYVRKATLVIGNGEIKGTAWRRTMPPAPSDIVFSRR